MVNDDIKDTIREFNEQNGKLDTKSLLIYFNTTLNKKLDVVSDKLSSLTARFKTHEERSNHDIDRLAKVSQEHDKILQHITDELPNKGFCDKTTSILDAWYKDSDIALDDKVDILWYDKQLQGDRRNWNLRITLMFASVITAVIADMILRVLA